jgi:alanine racemase
VVEAATRPAWAEIDLGAIRHNTRVLSRLAAPAELCAVVKADAYGHGAVPVARAALGAGATSLAVAVVEEAVELLAAGIAAPVLVLAEASREAVQLAVSYGVPSRAVPQGAVPQGSRAAAGDAGRAGVALSVYTPAGIRAAEAAGRKASCSVDVHLKMDSGMHRVGADPSEIVMLAREVRDSEYLRLRSVWTHLAVAEGVTDQEVSYTKEQIRLYEGALGRLGAAGIEVPLRHAANSAGTIAHPESRFDMVRCGIALYGQLPAAELVSFLDQRGLELRSALSFKARVVQTRRLGAGERPSYGRRRALGEDSVVAVVPVGYADGVPRAWFERGGSVLVRGRRRPLAGTVTMDMIVVDCGPDRDAEVEVGDEVVLIGRQGHDSLDASEWARALGTISYEVLCGIGPRVPRVFVDPGAGSDDSGTED